MRACKIKKARATPLWFILTVILFLIFGLAALRVVSQDTTFATSKSAAGIGNMSREVSPVETSGKRGAPPEVTDAMLERGKEIFAKQCVACHGADGKGQGSAAFLLHPKPRNLTNRLIKLTSNNDGLVDVNDLFDTITRGMPGSSMPSWSHYSEVDRWAITFYVKSLSRKDKRPPQPIQPPAEPPVTAEGLGLGRHIFIQSCAVCHGTRARDDGGQDQVDENGFPMRARDLTSGIFKGGRESLQLYRRVANGMPGSSMPAHADTLKPEQIWNVVHYIQSLSGFGGETRNRQEQRTIPAQKVSEVLADPSAPGWQNVKEHYVPLMPLWWRDDRPEGMVIRMAHDGKDLYVRVEWEDKSNNTSQLQAQNFRDGTAVQLSGEAEPPFFAMGQAGSTPVKIWHWKADREKDLASRQDIHTEHPNMYVGTYPDERRSPEASEKMGVDYNGRNDSRSIALTDIDNRYVTGLKAGNVVAEVSKSSVESLTSAGFGSLGRRPNVDMNVSAAGVWNAGVYSVVFKRSLLQEGAEALTLKPGSICHMAFAVWDGAASQRNGTKCASIWHKVALAE